MTEKTKTVYMVWLNKDNTEGRGPLYPGAVCEHESTALRMAKGAGVMGGTATVDTVEAIYIDASNVHTKWYAPVNIIPPSKSDLVDTRKTKAILSAKKAGLSAQTIRALTGD